MRWEEDKENADKFRSWDFYGGKYNLIIGWVLEGRKYKGYLARVYDMEHARLFESKEDAMAWVEGCCRLQGDI